jgi:hypothetical protein
LIPVLGVEYVLYRHLWRHVGIAIMAWDTAGSASLCAFFYEARAFVSPVPPPVRTASRARVLDVRILVKNEI